RGAGPGSARRNRRPRRRSPHRPMTHSRSRTSPYELIVARAHAACPPAILESIARPVGGDAAEFVLVIGHADAHGLDGRRDAPLEHGDEPFLTVGLHVHVGDLAVA